MSHESALSLLSDIYIQDQYNSTIFGTSSFTIQPLATGVLGTVGLQVSLDTL